MASSHPAPHRNVGGKHPGHRARLESKRQAILEGATTVFVERGFHGTSMDAISSLTGISKPTLYRHFASKEELFRAILQKETQQIEARLEAAATETGTTEEFLFRFAKAYANVIMEPNVLALARIVIGMAQELPELSHYYYDAAHQATTSSCVRMLSTLRDKKEITFSNGELTAEHFRALVLTSYYGPLLYRPTRQPRPAEIDTMIRQGVEVFLRAYAVDSPAP